METGEFPEGPVLSPWTSTTPAPREAINQAGYLETNLLGVEVAAKDSERYGEGR